MIPCSHLMLYQELFFPESHFSGPWFPQQETHRTIYLGKAPQAD